MKMTRKILFSFFAGIFAVSIAFSQDSVAVPAQDSISDAVLDSLIQLYNLDEVTVTGVRPLVKVELDKIIYNMAEDPDAKTMTVLDMLRRVPLITVDANNKISLRGSSNFVVYMNGKPSGMFAQNPEEVLRNMPANVVQNIEVITDPGARYDAEGVAGIINIVTVSQTSMDGFTTTINGGVNSLGGGDAGIYLMAKKGRIGFTGNLNSYRFNYPSSNIDKISENFLDNSRIFEKAKMDLYGYGLYGSGELSFEIDSLNLINVGYNTRYGRQNEDWKGTISQVIADEFLYATDRTEKSKLIWGGTDFNVDYQRTSAKNAERLLTLSYRFSYSPRDRDKESHFFNPTGNFPSVIPLDRTRQYTDARTNEHTFQLDYSTPLGKIHSLETGLKYIVRLNKSNSNYLIFSDSDGWQAIESGDLRNDITLFKHRNDIMSAYGSYALKLGKWGLRTGLRYEYTLLDVVFERNKNLNFDKNYGNFVPSILGTYQINDSQNIRLGYNMRLNRPGIWHLNPYINDANPNFIEQGNPNLNSVQTHSVSLNYGFFRNRFNLNANLSYDFTNNSIEQITQIGDGGTSISTYQNIGEKQDTRLAVYFNWTPVEWFRLYSNLGTSYVDIRANDGSLPNRYFFSGWAFSGADYRLPYKVWLTANVGGGSPWRSLQETHGNSWWHYFTLRRDFLNNKLNVRLYASNLFVNSFSMKHTVKNPSFYQETNLNIRPREFGFIVSYRFGELRAQLKKTARSIANDDVIEGGGAQGERR